MGRQWLGTDLTCDSGVGLHVQGLPHPLAWHSLIGWPQRGEGRPSRTVGRCGAGQGASLEAFAIFGAGRLRQLLGAEDVAQAHSRPNQRLVHHRQDCDQCGAAGLAACLPCRGSPGGGPAPSCSPQRGPCHPGPGSRSSCGHSPGPAIFHLWEVGSLRGVRLGPQASDCIPSPQHTGAFPGSPARS